MMRTVFADEGTKFENELGANAIACGVPVRWDVTCRSSHVVMQQNTEDITIHMPAVSRSTDTHTRGLEQRRKVSRTVMTCGKASSVRIRRLIVPYSHANSHRLSRPFGPFNDKALNLNAADIGDYFNFF